MHRENSRSRRYRSIVKRLPPKRGECAGYDGHKKKKGTKIHVAVSSEGLPLSVAISAGNEHNSLHFAAVADKIELKGIRGRPKRGPCEINADAAFDTGNIRIYLRKRGIKANIPVNKRNRKQPKRGRPFRFDKASYATRAAVERFNSVIESFKRILVRFERLKESFLAFIN